MSDEEEPIEPERRDEDGLPLDRPPTLDDVRGESASHRRLAIGCSLAAIALVAGFWLLRTLL
jgi:hypothetical protein